MSSQIAKALTRDIVAIHDVIMEYPDCHSSGHFKRHFREAYSEAITAAPIAKSEEDYKRYLRNFVDCLEEKTFCLQLGDKNPLSDRKFVWTKLPSGKGSFGILLTRITQMAEHK